MFDRVEIRVKGGDGGNGVVSFRREKLVPFGGPDGGDGGDGGDIVLKADENISDLLSFRNRGFYRAGKGKSGGSSKKRGKNGENLMLAVPMGTVVLSKKQIGGESLLADLAEPGQEVIVARGGKGGLGNIHFASPTHQTPQIAQKGEVGEENSIILELRLIADVGIIGYPNVGKSSLLAAATAAKPKIASYPFTTLEPILGVVEVGQKSFVLAEIPGLIEGAHLGRGLGHDFLRHVMRTKILIHLTDGSSVSPVDDMIKVNTELSLFDSSLSQKPQLVVVNKIDLPEMRTRLAEIQSDFGKAGIKANFISVLTGEGVPELLDESLKLLNRVTAEAKAGVEIPRKVFRPQPRERGTGIHKEGDTFVVVAPELERLVAKGGETTPELRWYLKGQLDRLGINKALEKAGVKPGDKIRCGDIEWPWE